MTETDEIGVALVSQDGDRDGEGADIAALRRDLARLRMAAAIGTVPLTSLGDAGRGAAVRVRAAESPADEEGAPLPAVTRGRDVPAAAMEEREREPEATRLAPRASVTATVDVAEPERAPRELSPSPPVARVEAAAPAARPQITIHYARSEDDLSALIRAPAAASQPETVHVAATAAQSSRATAAKGERRTEALRAVETEVPGVRPAPNMAQPVISTPPPISPRPVLPATEDAPRSEPAGAPPAPAVARAIAVAGSVAPVAPALLPVREAHESASLVEPAAATPRFEAADAGAPRTALSEPAGTGVRTGRDGDGTLAAAPFGAGPNTSSPAPPVATHVPTRPKDGDGHAAAKATMAGDVFLDGALLGRWMERMLGRAASRPSAGPSGFDARRSPLLPGTTVGTSP